MAYADNVTVGRVAGAAVLGKYALAFLISTAVATRVGLTAVRVGVGVGLSVSLAARLWPRACLCTQACRRGVWVLGESKV